MSNTLAILGLFSALSICELCGSSSPSAVRLPAPVTAPPTLSFTQPPAKAATATRTVTLTVKGMTCGGCVLSTRKVLTRLEGVTNADVSYEKGTAVVTYDPSKVTVKDMVAAIKTLGYTAVPASAG
jgi:mercuric ion binding protein